MTASHVPEPGKDRSNNDRGNDDRADDDGSHDDHDDRDDGYSQRSARKRSLTVQGRATSIFISDEMWRDFQRLAAEQNLTANRLVSIIRARTGGSLGKAIRMYIVNSRVGGSGGR